MYMDEIKLMKRVDITVVSAGPLSCGVCMFSECLCGLPVGSLVSFQRHVTWPLGHVRCKKV